MKRTTSLEFRELVVKLHKEGKSPGEIGKLVGRATSTIQHIVISCQNNGNCDYNTKCGRPRKLTGRDERIIVDMVRKNPQRSAPNMCPDVVQATQKTLSESTVRRILRHNDYFSRKACKKPLISPANIEKRLFLQICTWRKDRTFGNRFFSLTNPSLTFSDTMDQ